MFEPTTFNNTQIDIIDHNGQPWVTAEQLGLALGYGRGVDQSDDTFARRAWRSVINLYNRHVDEFTDSMTAVVPLPTAGGEQETRIFSPRGCHLVAMFSRTPIAKAFRVWVLNVLEGIEPQRQTRQHDIAAATLEALFYGSRKKPGVVTLEDGSTVTCRIDQDMSDAIEITAGREWMAQRIPQGEGRHQALARAQEFITNHRSQGRKVIVNMPKGFEYLALE